MICLYDRLGLEMTLPSHTQFSVEIYRHDGNHDIAKNIVNNFQIKNTVYNYITCYRLRRSEYRQLSKVYDKVI